MPGFITDVKGNLRPCDSQKVKAKYANAQRKMLSMWLTVMTEPLNMKADYDDLKELLQAQTVTLNSPDLVAEGLTYARINEILYDKCVQATSKYHPFMVNLLILALLKSNMHARSRNSTRWRTTPGRTEGLPRPQIRR